MDGNTYAFSPLEYVAPHSRVGVVACAALNVALTVPLRQIQASYTRIDADTTGPGDRELERYHALILQVGDGGDGSKWFRPEILQTNTCPLLLAGEPDAIYYRASLQVHADDVIFAPFAANELIVRLSRLMSGTSPGRHAFARPARPCVLVADDDRDIVTYLDCVLQTFDVDVHFASNGVAALAAARRLLPDLVLLDIGMPILSGLDVLRCLKNDPGTCDIPTLLLTASSDPLDVAKGAEFGAADYILKPFGHIALIRKLKILLPERNLRARAATAGDSILFTRAQESAESRADVRARALDSSSGRLLRVRL
jgi:DNA-binding response OmpR family regulator